MLRTFLYINMSIFLVTFIGLTMPVISDDTITQASEELGKELMLHVSDIFLGTGYLSTTSLFYGFYGLSSTNKESLFSKDLMKSLNDFC